MNLFKTVCTITSCRLLAYLTVKISTHAAPTVAVGRWVMSTKWCGRHTFFRYLRICMTAGLTHRHACMTAGLCEAPKKKASQKKTVSKRNKPLSTKYGRSIVFLYIHYQSRSRGLISLRPTRMPQDMVPLKALVIGVCLFGTAFATVQVAQNEYCGGGASHASPFC